MLPLNCVTVASNGGTLTDIEAGAATDLCGGTLTDIEAGAATELYHCGLHHKFIQEYFKLKAYSNLTHSSSLPLCAI